MKVRDQNPIVIRNIKDCSLFFNSRFESGNLKEVEKVNDLEYNLYMNFDYNTLNYTQWYYFSVRNIKKGIILNIIKIFTFYRFHIQI